MQQLRAIELNAYAYELAQVSVQIGFLQWRRDNGFDNDRSPVLQNLEGLENKDALLNETFRKKPRNLKAAQAEEHGGQDELFKVYTERAWPSCDVIVGNPPFLGDKIMRRELGDPYVDELRAIFSGRIPGQSDLCCYWFEKAREQIEHGDCKRAGLLATQGIRGGANRTVLERIRETGGIFFAESDRNWILAGANVHVSMVGFALVENCPSPRLLDGMEVTEINPNLTSASRSTDAVILNQNARVGFIGVAQKAPFDLSDEDAQALLPEVNPNGRPNSDVLTLVRNAEDITRRPRHKWNVDFGLDMKIEAAALYEKPFEQVKKVVYPLRLDHREARQTRYWWLFARPCPDMRKGLAGLPRFLATPRVSKYRVFIWLTPELLCDSAVVAFARDDDYCFGVLHSRLHEIWALALGTQLREIESGFRYTPTTCFETFPFPFPDDLACDKDAPSEAVAKFRAAHYHTAQDNVLREEPPPLVADEHRDAIASAAKELNELRERWLNPPEWTQTHVLEFPGSMSGPWARYVDASTLDAQTGVGTVRYPRVEPRDADCAAKLKKRTLTNLYNERPTWLDLAHKRLDAAVANAYGFPADLSDEQILERLLALNLERGAEEAKEAKGAKPKASREKRGDELL